MRILISQSETDLLSIRAEFKKKFGKSLYSSLQVRLRWFLTWSPGASPLTSTLRTVEHSHVLENSWVFGEVSAGLQAPHKLWASTRERTEYLSHSGGGSF